MIWIKDPAPPRRAGGEAMEAMLQTRGEQMLALRRSRMAASPPILRGGFRPFFLASAIWAVTALTIWLLALTGTITLASAFDPLAWHRHEMLFGFAGAAIAGFQLTAIPNWTGRLPVAGPPLAALVGLWLAGRVAVLFSQSFSIVAAIVDASFFLVLAVVAMREVVATSNRHLPIVGLMLLFGIVNGLDHWAAAGSRLDPEVPWRLGLALVTLLISLVGGRIIPSFTRNWLFKQGVKKRLPGQPGAFDQAATALTALAFLGWIAAPAGPLPASLLALAAAAQAIRLSRWKGWRTARDPLVFILHLGYAWLPIGLALLAAAQINPSLPQSAAVHGLTAGAMGTMILAVMTRSILSQTGRDLTAGVATTILYALVTLGAGLRIAASLGLVEYQAGIETAGMAWAGAFLLFLIAYGPILFAPRVGERW